MQIFDYIDIIAFKKKKPTEFKCEMGDAFSVFMINRWLSMCNNTYVNVVNETSNKYATCIGTRDEQYQFLYNVMPQARKQKINYIKKAKKEKDLENKDNINMIKLLAKKYEISEHEVNEMLKT